MENFVPIYDRMWENVQLHTKVNNKVKVLVKHTLLSPVLGHVLHTYIYLSIGYKYSKPLKITVILPIWDEHSEGWVG